MKKFFIAKPRILGAIVMATTARPWCLLWWHEKLKFSDEFFFVVDFMPKKIFGINICDEKYFHWKISC